MKIWGAKMNKSIGQRLFSVVILHKKYRIFQLKQDYVQVLEIFNSNIQEEKNERCEGLCLLLS